MLKDAQHTRFTEFWTDAQPAVLAYVRAVVRDAHAARDIVQNTAVVLMRKFEQWDASRPFLPWALGFAKFEVLAYQRDSGRCRLVFDEALLDAMTQSWPGIIDEVDRERSALRECLGTLAPKAREIVRLRYFDELDVSEVAERTSSTAGAARVALLRIRRQLQECVNHRLNKTGEDL